jgi:ectoine hydroxylase-related dioxygenase (phytanoyl-CoA dioxygenase family)
MSLIYLESTNEGAVVADVLRREGAVAVKNVVEPELVDTIAAALRPQLDADGLRSRGIFNGDLTRRCGSPLSTAPSVAELVDHDLVIEVLDEILLPFASTYRISSLSPIEIMPGEKDQALHRDDTVYPIDIAGMELTVGVMWALSDFTAENGGTRVIPGSHRYLRAWHLPDLSRWEATVMSKGSAVFYLGSTWHGGGANRSNAPRLGIVNTYCLGWLRPEENQYLTTPPEIAARYGPRLRALLGYMAHGSGDDNCGGFKGECPAWVATPPRATWRGERGQAAIVENAKSQGGG